jgi:hypothetical protein
MAIAASHTAYFQGMRQEFAGIAKNGFGIGIYEFYSGEIELRDERQKWLGNYSGTGIVSYISYARKIYEDVSIGTTFKGIYEKLWVNTLKGYAFDFGLNYIPVSALSVSAVVDNIGPTMHYGIDNAERIRLPFMVKIGSSYTYQNLLFCAELRKAIDEVLRGNIGLELSPLPQLSLRMGYRIKYDTENFSAGLGLNYKNYKIDYAFVPMRLNLGSCHWLTLGAMLP